jgi:hypothetical protein
MQTLRALSDSLPPCEAEPLVPGNAMNPRLPMQGHEFAPAQSAAGRCGQDTAARESYALSGNPG